MKETGKRIVSKGEYAKIQANRASGTLIGGCLMFMAILCAIIVIAAWAGLVGKTTFVKPTFGGLVIGLGPVLIIGVGIYGLYALGLNLVKEARTLDPGIPFTHANTADLPAPDSLVRASEEPVQEQQAVLLRAAMNGEQTPSEQLVRPAEASQESAH